MHQSVNSHGTILAPAPVRKDEEDRTEKALEAFLDDIEEDKEYRANFMLYKNQDYRPSTESENEEDDLHIGMEEVRLAGGHCGWSVLGACCLRLERAVCGWLTLLNPLDRPLCP